VALSLALPDRWAVSASFLRSFIVIFSNLIKRCVLLQSVQNDSYRAADDYASDSALVSSSLAAQPNSGLIISNSTPKFQDRLHTARRVFGLVPVIVFLLSLALFMSVADPSLYGFSHALLRVIAVSLASSIVCIAAYGFYRYLLDRSSGL
jgi:hypothetical protein